MTAPRHTFAVYATRPGVAPERIGYIQASGELDAHDKARELAAGREGPFLLKLTKRRTDLTSYLQLNSFVRGQDRIGLTVYRAPCAGKRAKNELTIGAEVACLYDLSNNRRKLIQQWELT